MDTEASSNGTWVPRAALFGRIRELERQLRAERLALVALTEELKRLKEDRKDAAIEG